MKACGSSEIKWACGPGEEGGAYGRERAGGSAREKGHSARDPGAAGKERNVGGEEMRRRRHRETCHVLRGHLGVERGNITQRICK